MNKCPDCKCDFMQPFVCVTCGAQKLYDNTVFSLQSHNEALRARIAELEARLALAEKVCEAAERAEANGEMNIDCFSISDTDARAVHEALAAWRAQK